MEHKVLADFMSAIRDKKEKQTESGKCNVQIEASGKIDGSDSRSKGEKSMVGKGNSAGGKNVTKGENRRTPTKQKRGADGHMVKVFNSSIGKSSSRLRPRKELPVFRKVELDDGDNEKIVGKRIKVYWSGSKRWFPGCINSFDGAKHLHKIHYEDGEEEELNLRSELFELEMFPSDSFTLKTKPINVKRKKGSIRVEGGSEIFQKKLDDAASPEHVNKKIRQKEKAYKMFVEKSCSTNPERKETEGRKKNDGYLSTAEDMNTHPGNIAGKVVEVKSLDDSKSILEVGTPANEAVKLPATKLNDVKKEIEKAVKGDPGKAKLKPLKTYARRNKRRVQGDAAMSISMMESGKETKLLKNPAGDSLDVANNMSKYLLTDIGLGIHKSKEEVAGENHRDRVCQKIPESKAVGEEGNNESRQSETYFCGQVKV